MLLSEHSWGVLCYLVDNYIEHRSGGYNGLTSGIGSSDIFGAGTKSPPEFVSANRAELCGEF
jgi:hypothetical protein